MEIKRCENGHFYDAEANSTCPQCAAEMGMGGYSMETTYGQGFDNYGATEPVGGSGGYGGYGSTEAAGGSGGGFENYGATEPVGGFGGGVEDIGATMPGGGFGGGVADIGVTMPGGGFKGGSGSYGQTEGFDSTPKNPKPLNGGGMMEDYGVTVVAYPGNKAPVGFSPVVGWLVCIEGPAKGKDYRIRAGYNTFGRDEHMDICIRGNQEISGEHGVITYDYKTHMFYIERTKGKNPMYINGEIVLSPTKINVYDEISIGETKLMFVPLCGERFNWNE